jgi:predicted aspartyl protease
MVVAACMLLACAVADAEPFEHLVPMKQQASGNYYVTGHLPGAVEAELLVDTGSGYVSLSKSTFEKVKRTSGVEYLRDIYGAMANGRTMKVPVYRIATLSLGECELRDVEVAVFPGAARDILGLNALREVQPFAMQLEPPTLFLSNCAHSSAASERSVAMLN